METRRIGSLDVSVVGLGCNNFGRRCDEEATRRVVDASLDAGVTFLDTADIYGGTKSEEFLGRILQGRHDRVVLATKFGMEVAPGKSGAAPDYIKRAVADSLHRLQIDHIDLYQLHEPDASVPIADTLAALDELVQAGMVREIGCSNFSASQLREAADAVADGAARFVSVQNELSLLERGRRDRRPAGRGRAWARVHPLLPARERGTDRQVPAREASAGRHPAGRASRGADRSRLRPNRGAHRLCRGARPHAARARDRLAALLRSGRLGHHRRDPSRTDPSQRGGLELAPERR